MNFAAATAVESRGDGTYDATIHEGWDIAGNANGGYLLAIMGRALLAESGRPDPVTVSCHYLRPGRPGRVGVRVETVRTGRMFSTLRATMTDVENRPLLTVLGTVGERPTSTDAALAGRSDDVAELVEGRPPELPPFEDCRPRSQAGGPGAPGFSTQVEMRLHPEDSRFAEGIKTGRAEMRGWFVLPDGQEMDTVTLLTAVDAFPPTIFHTDLPVAWSPTVELTAHVRERPARGPLRCRFSTRFVTGGFLEEDGEIWDSAGRLVAHSRQLALVPRA